MTTKPTIAIDVDEVLADYAAEFVLLSNRLWGTNFKVEDYHEDWLSLWGVDMNEALIRRDVLLADRMHERLKHNDEAVDVLNQLSEHYKLVVLTARNSDTKQMTVEWIHRHYPMISSDNINFAGIWDNPKPNAAKQTKGQVAKQLGANYLIDDQPKHCFAAAEHGISSLLFGDYSWNQIEILPANVNRVINWSAVREYFDNET